LSLTGAGRKIKVMPWCPLQAGSALAAARACAGSLLVGLVVLGGVDANARADEPAGFPPAKAGYNVTSWTVEDGLPMQNITALAQTTDGFLWCGTFDGLARFDGLEFKVYYPYEVPELADFKIVRLLGDSAGGLWILDAQGRLAIWQNDRFKRMTTQEGVPEGGFGQIFAGLDGEILARERAEGTVWHYRNGRFERATTFANGEGLMSDCRVTKDGLLWGIGSEDGRLALLVKGDIGGSKLAGRRFGRFWSDVNGTTATTSASGVWVYARTNWALQHRFEAPIAEAQPVDACQDRNGNYWIGTRNRGLFLSRSDGWTVRVELPAEIPGTSVNSLMLGREGNVWAGTSAGLYRITRNDVQSWSDLAGFSAGAVRSLAEDKSRRLWVVQEQQVWWGASNTNQLRLAPVSGPGRVFWRAAVARDDGIWLAASSRTNHRGEIWSVSPERASLIGTLPGERVEDLLESSRGELLAATPHGLFRRNGDTFETAGPDEARGKPVVALAEDRQGRVYVAVTDVGLFRGEAGGWRRLTQRSDPGSDRIQAFGFDAGGTLWIAADRPGLARWQNEHWVGFAGFAEGMPRKSRALVADNGDGLWLASRWGLARMSRRELNLWVDQRHGEFHVSWLDSENGLASVNCAASPSGLCKDGTGRLWVATAGGLYVADPAAWDHRAADSVPPHVQIEKVVADDVPLTGAAASDSTRDPAPLYTVPAGSQRLEIHFTGINLTSSDKMRFWYRLRGFDNGWVSLTGPRLVHFTRLPPGQYRFELSAANNEGVVSREAGIRLRVQPEWWQRASVRAVAGFAVLGLLWLAGYVQIVRLRRQRARQLEFSRQLLESQEQERKRIAGELHDSLGQNLLVAKNLALTGANACAREPVAAKALAAISDCLSTALTETRNISKALRPPELDRLGLTKALCGMVQRAGEASGIACRIHIEDIDGLLPESQEINVYRLVQEGMNNVVRHSRAREAVVEIRHHPDHLALRLADDGVGFDPGARVSEESAGSGIKAMQERALVAGGEFRLTSQPGNGTTLDIRIPVQPPPP